jgi:hypothetical protein
MLAIALVWRFPLNVKKHEIIRRRLESAHLRHGLKKDEAP